MHKQFLSSCSIKERVTFLLIPFSIITVSIFLFLATIRRVDHVDPISIEHESLLPFCWQTTDTVFVFGDSYSAIQGKEGSGSTWNRFKTGHAFSSAEILPNTTRSGGPAWNEYLTGCYEGLPQNCSPQRLFNMAYSGATVSRRLVKVRWPIIADFIKQVQLWKSKVVPKVKWTNALAMVWFLNDVHKSEAVPDDKIEELYQKILKVYFDQMEILYDSNMRHFAFMNVPPIDRTPKYTAVQAHLASRVELFNTMLKAHINEFQEAHPEGTNTTIIEIDTHQIFSTLQDNAQDYGIYATTGYYDQKKKNPLPLEQYFYKDEFHPTYVVHKAFADAIQEQLDMQSNCELGYM